MEELQLTQLFKHVPFWIVEWEPVDMSFNQSSLSRT